MLHHERLTIIRGSPLHDAGVAFHPAGVKGPVLEQLYRAGLIGELGEDHVFLSTHEAMTALTDTNSLPSSM